MQCKHKNTESTDLAEKGAVITMVCQTGLQLIISVQLDIWNGQQ